MNKPSIIQRARESLNTTRQLANLLAPQKGKVFLFLAISVLASVSEGVSISLLIPILETMSSGSSMSSVPVLGEVNSYFQRYDPEIRLQFVAGSMFAIIVARGAFLYLASYLASTMPLQVRYELITQMYRDLIATRLSYLHGQDSGALLNNLLSQPNRISGAIGSFTSMVVNALVIGVYVLLMLAMSWQLTFISLAFMFVLSLIVRKFMNRSIRLRGEQVTNLYEQAHQVMYETLNGIKQILLSSAQPVMQHHFANIARSELEARYGQERLQQGIFPIFTIASGGLICSLILLSSLGQSLDLSAVILFTFVLFRLMSPVSAINNASASLQSNIHAFTDITKFQNQLNLAKQPSGDIPYRTLRDKIVFDDVSFHYDTANEPTLEHVSFSIPKSAMVAIVGPSGAGKSTITNLLANFYEPTSGKILIDDVNLRDLDLDSWRRCIGLVSQDIVLFNDTIRNNIAFANEDATLDDIRAAADLAAIDRFIMEELPQGYDTPVGDRGVRLSGGQQQRLSMARAILNKPDLMILDEATSHLDSITENAIRNAVETLRKTTTILVIAHRLSTIRHADVIVVVNNGRVVATGPHDELMETSHLYQSMIANQQLDLVDEAAEDNGGAS